MTVVLTASDVAALLRRDEVRDALEEAHADLARGLAQVPAPAAMTSADRGSHLPMAAVAGRYAGVKMLADLPANAERGLPVQRSAILLTSAATGECLALVDGRLVTAVRTAAASAVATRHLARRDATVLGLVGAGALAVEHTRAIAKIRPIERVVVWSRTEATLTAYRREIDGLDLEIVAAADAEEVVRTAEVVCTLTPSRTPLVRGAWFGAGLHVNAVGAPPRPDHREVDGAGLARARLIVDSRATALAKSGEVLLAIAEGHITEDDLTDLGQVIVGAAPGRTGDDDITLFNSVGLGLQDVVTAGLLVEHARREKVGTTVDLRS
ncbi:ornithine cyclodeaminase family protein [Actinoplanes rectilineatus]|uniref:ornithine cyclodeaminase family protein n=1 Tax=Actinoplanes rectilineatus TaxID=113571 RepID=UPI0005F2BF49|nr:ornithine cyclodeaminase family protein [Actinoplanes rectilineatus]